VGVNYCVALSRWRNCSIRRLAKVRPDKGLKKRPRFLDSQYQCRHRTTLTPVWGLLTGNETLNYERMMKAITSTAKKKKKMKVL